VAGNVAGSSQPVAGLPGMISFARRGVLTSPSGLTVCGREILASDQRSLSWSAKVSLADKYARSLLPSRH
jgi:hypothetical protein